MAANILSLNSPSKKPKTTAQLLSEVDLSSSPSRGNSQDLSAKGVFGQGLSTTTGNVEQPQPIGDFNQGLATKSTAQLLSEAPLPEAQPKEDSGDFVRGISTAFKQVPQLAYGLEAGAGAVGEHLLGEGGVSTSIKEHGVKGYKEWSDIIEANSKDTDSATTAWGKAQGGDLGALVDWLQYGAGYTLGQGAQLLATVGIGGIAAKGVGVGAAKMAGSMVSKEAAKILEAGVGRKLSEEELAVAAESFGKEALAKQAVANVSTTIGRTAVVGTQAFGMEGGEIFGDLTAKANDEGRQLTGAELAKAFGATLAAGGLEFVGDKFGLDVALGKASVLKGAAGTAAKIGATGAATAGIEGGTEFGQTIIEEYGKGNDPFTESGWKNIWDATALGALGGGLVGAGSGALHRGNATPEQESEIDSIKQSLSDVDAKTAAETAASVPEEKVMAALAAANELLDEARANSNESDIASASSAVTTLRGRLKVADAKAKPLAEGVTDLANDAATKVEEVMASPDAMAAQNAENEAANKASEATNGEETKPTDTGLAESGVSKPSDKPQGDAKNGVLPDDTGSKYGKGAKNSDTKRPATSNDGNKPASGTADGKDAVEADAGLELRSDGNPFKNEATAERALKNRKLSKTHAVVEHKDGFALAKITEKAVKEPTKVAVPTKIDQKPSEEPVKEPVKELVKKPEVISTPTEKHVAEDKITAKDGAELTITEDGTLSRKEVSDIETDVKSETTPVSDIAEPTTNGADAITTLAGVEDKIKSFDNAAGALKFFKEEQIPESVSQEFKDKYGSNSESPEKSIERAYSELNKQPDTETSITSNPVADTQRKTVDDSKGFGDKDALSILDDMLGVSDEETKVSDSTNDNTETTDVSETPETDKVDETSSEKPVTDVTSNPVEEPKAEEPKAEGPKVEEPKVEEQTDEQKAEALGKSATKLKKHFEAHIQTLDAETKKNFDINKKRAFSAKNKTLRSVDGKQTLQWKVRKDPAADIGEGNEQSDTGHFELITKEEKPKEDKSERGTRLKLRGVGADLRRYSGSKVALKDTGEKLVTKLIGITKKNKNWITKKTDTTTFGMERYLNSIIEQIPTWQTVTGSSLGGSRRKYGRSYIEVLNRKAGDGEEGATLIKKTAEDYMTTLAGLEFAVSKAGNVTEAHKALVDALILTDEQVSEQAIDKAAFDKFKKALFEGDNGREAYLSDEEAFYSDTGKELKKLLRINSKNIADVVHVTNATEFVTAENVEYKKLKELRRKRFPITEIKRSDKMPNHWVNDGMDKLSAITPKEDVAHIEAMALLRDNNGNVTDISEYNKHAQAMVGAEVEQELIKRFDLLSLDYGDYAESLAPVFIQHLYNSFMDYATLNNVNPRAIGAGNLQVAYGALGRARHAAHYDSSSDIINMTRDNGDGALNHEMSHYLDGGRGSGGLIKGKFAAKAVSDMYHVLKSKFNDERIEKILDEIMAKKRTDFVLRGQGKVSKSGIVSYAKRFLKGDWRDGKYEIIAESDYLEAQGSASEYWQRDTELWARANETRAAMKLASEGKESLYLQGKEANPASPDFFSAANGYKHDAYPMGDEAIAFNEAIDYFWANTKEVEVDGHIELQINEYESLYEAKISQMQESATKLLDGLEERYKLLNNPVSEDGKYWYRYLTTSRGKHQQPSDIAGYDDTQGAVAYNEPLDDSDIGKYGLEAVEIVAGDDTRYTGDNNEAKDSKTLGDTQTEDDGQAKKDRDGSEGVGESDGQGGEEKGDAGTDGQGDDSSGTGGSNGGNQVGSGQGASSSSFGGGSAESTGGHRPANRNYQLDEEQATDFDKKAQFTNSITAIRELVSIGDKKATAEQQEDLALYDGFYKTGAELYEWSSSTQHDMMLDILSDVDNNGSTLAVAPESNNVSVQVIDTVYESMKAMGFKGGRILNVNAGHGRFIGRMPEDIEQNSKVVAIEDALIPAAIAKQLYQKTNVINQKLTETNFVPRSYNTAIVDVSERRSLEMTANDEKGNKDRLKNAWYAVDRALSATSKDGVVFAIVPMDIMEGYESRIERKVIGDHAKILGAFGLPKESAQAGRYRTTSLAMLVLQPAENAVANRKFISGDLIGLDEKISDLSKISRQLPADLLKEKEIEAYVRPDPAASLPKGDDLFEGSFFIKSGNIHQMVEGADITVDVPARGADKFKKRITDMIKIRGAYRKYMSNAFSGKPTTADRKALAKFYDVFVKEHGFLNSKANIRRLEDDPDYPKLMSLEEYNEELETGEKGRIFKEAPLLATGTPEHVQSLDEAMQWSLNDSKQGIDIGYIAHLTGRSKADIIAGLNGKIYLDPRGDVGWVTRDEYLSGNIKDKLELAEAAAHADPDVYNPYIKQLKAAMPEKLSKDAIKAQLGAPWLTIKTLNDFINHMVPGAYVAVERNNDVGRTVIAGKSSSISAAKTDVRDAKRMTVATSTWGLPAKGSSFFDILDVTLNGGIVSKGKNESIELLKMQENIKAEFSRWVREDYMQGDELADVYNDYINTSVKREFDGTHLKFSGMSRFIDLRPHQRSAVWRILSTGNTYLAHDVGIGKTFTFIAAAMEAKRLGIVKKPVISGLASNISEIKRDIFKLYPTARVESFKIPQDVQKAQAVLAQIQASTADIITINHDSMDKIRVSAGGRMAELQIEKLRLDRALKDKGYTDSKIRNQIRSELDSNNKAMKELNDVIESEKNVISFEDTGIDMMIVDEAHNYKNLKTKTKLAGVKGTVSGDSDKTKNFFYQMQVLSRNKGIAVLSSATPMANSVSELYTASRYLQLDRLNELNLALFDQWAATFGDIGNGVEFDATSKSYQAITRFRGFANMPEMMGLIGEVMDVATVQQMVKGAKKTGEKITVPNKRGGSFTSVIVPQSDEQAAYTQDVLKPRVQAIKEDRNTALASGDNMLVVFNDSNKAALDMRLVDPKAKSTKHSKVTKTVENVMKEYKDSGSFKGTQLIFLDSSTPKKEFNVYDDIKSRLIKEGIPESEIAFYHNIKEKDRVAFFNKVNRGDYRVVIGGTKTLGTGVNVQERVAAVHHIDISWNIADFIQRNGRAIRQGNINKEVAVYVYATEKSGDTVMWDKVQAKARTYGALFEGDSSVRETSELSSSETISANEFAALTSGNPLIKEKSDVETLLDFMRREKRTHEVAQKKMKLRLAEEESFIKEFPKTKNRMDDEVLKWDGLDTLDATGERNAGLKVGGNAFKKYVEETIANADAKTSIIAIGSITNGQGAVSVSVTVDDKRAVESYIIDKNVKGSTIGRAVSSEKADAEKNVEALIKRKAAADAEVKTIKGLFGKKYGKLDELAKAETRLKEINESMAKEAADDNKKSRGAISSRTSTPEKAVSEVERIVGKAVSVKAVDSLGGDTQGTFSPSENAIEIAKNVKDPEQTAWHESFHALVANTFNPSQLAILNRAFKKDKPLRRQIERLMKERGLGKVLASKTDFNTEEAQAYAFQSYMLGEFQPKGLIERFFHKLRQIIEAVSNAIAGNGLNTAEGIFEKAKQGGFAKGFAKQQKITPKQIAHAKSAGKGNHIVTASFDKVSVPTKIIAELNMHNGKKGGNVASKNDALAKSIGDNGYDSESVIDIVVDGDGVASIKEGNHRAKQALKAGVERVPVKITYIDGGEDVAGDLRPSVVTSGNYAKADEYHDELRKSRGDFSYLMRDELIKSAKKKGGYKESGISTSEAESLRDDYAKRSTFNDSTQQHPGKETARFENVDVSTKAAISFIDQTRAKDYDPNKAIEIARDMRDNGYDKNEPIEIWIDQDGKPIMHDGLHRLYGAIRAGYSQIPVKAIYHNGGEIQSGAFNPNDLALYKSGATEFDVKRSRGDFAGTPDEELDAYTSAISKIGNERQLPSMTERLSEAASSRSRLAFRVQWVDRFNAVYDYELRRFAAANPQMSKKEARKNFGSHDSYAYMSMRNAVHSGKNAEAWMTLGQMRWKKEGDDLGVPELLEGKKGLFNILKEFSTNEEMESFFNWMVGKRAKRLMGEHREGGIGKDGERLNLFTPEEIEALIEQANGQDLNKFQAVMDELNEYDRNKLQFLKDAGGITESGMEAMLKYGDYVPFYRMIEDSVASPKENKGLVQGNGIFKLHGGKLDINSIIENLYMNTNAIVESAFKAKAMKRLDKVFQFDDGSYDTDVWEPKGLNFTAGLAQAGSALDSISSVDELGQARHEELKDLALKQDFDMGDIPKSAQNELIEVMSAVVPNSAQITSFILDGKRVYRKVNDPLVVRAVDGLNHQKSHAPKWAKAPKQLLTRMVTADPAFGVANAMRDWLSIMATTDVDIPITGSVTGFVDSFKRDDKYNNAWISGALPTAGYLQGASEDVLQAHVNRLKDITFGEGKIVTGVYKAIEMLDTWSSHFENAGRLGLYGAALESGKYTEEQAAFLALDTLDFSMHGDGAAILFFNDTVPFMNARIQGLYRLGKGFQEHRGALLRVGAAIMVASIALAMINHDDKRYKALPEYDKDTYWHFWIGSEHFRFPKPFEVGALTGTLPERMIELLYEGDVDLFRDRIVYAVLNTFNLNPIPQVAKPVLEVFANKSFFTGRSIVPLSKQNMDKSLQFNPYTSPTTREIAQLMKWLPDLGAPTDALKSPVVMEHAIRSYFGAIGGYTLGGLDTAVRAGLGYPPAPQLTKDNIFVLGRFWRVDSPMNTKYLPALYDMQNSITEVENTLRAYRKSGDFEAVREYRSDNVEVIKASSKVKNAMKQIRIQKKILERLYKNSGNIQPAPLRKKVDAVQTRINSIAERVYGEHTKF